jgi:ATP-dependent Clp protease adaptor protein ClpS
MSAGGRGGAWSGLVVRLAPTPQSRPVLEQEVGPETTVEPPWITILWNCDCHTFEQVARQLMKAIACSYDEGMTIAGRVHNEGKAVVRVGPKTECTRVGRILAEIGLRVSVAES